MHFLKMLRNGSKWVTQWKSFHKKYKQNPIKEKSDLASRKTIKRAREVSDSQYLLHHEVYLAVIALCHEIDIMGYYFWKLKDAVSFIYDKCLNTYRRLKKSSSESP